MANFGKPNLDFTLFLRPFTRGSWTVVGILTFVCISVALVYQLSPMKIYQGQDSARIATFNIWIFFLLLISFYRGSLTKFFTTKSAHPFTTVRQGLNNPDWKMIMVDGTEIWVQPFAEGDNPDPLFKRWWQAAHASEAATKEHFLPSYEKAVIQLLEARYFLFGEENMVAAELPLHGMDIEVMGRTKKQTHMGTILLPRASPLKKFFDKGCYATKKLLV